MGLTLITPPAAEPVSLAELKGWLRIDSDDEDALIASAGAAAREFVETALGRQLVTAEYALTLNAFPCGVIHLPRPPVQAVTSVAWRDGAGAVTTMAAGADYRVDLTADPGTIAVVKSWPRAGDYPDAVEVEFTAGYGDPADVPEKVKTAIKALASWWFEQREGASGLAMHEAPMHVRSLIQQARVWRAA